MVFGYFHPKARHVRLTIDSANNKLFSPTLWKNWIFLWEEIDISQLQVIMLTIMQFGLENNIIH